jgi:SAM-dependent methyltransferase
VDQRQAELYALTHRGNAGDREFYAAACRGAASVLELGAGYGRLLPALSAVSREVTALEREPWLLTAARRELRRLPKGQQRRLSLLRGDMQRFDLGRRFERIILPYNGLYCLLGRRALLACFRCVKRHLEPGGLFLFDVWAADAFQRRAAAAAYHDDDGPILTICRGTQTWDVFETSRLRQREQRLDVVYTYVSRERGTRVTIPIEQRYAPSTELRALLERAGLSVKATQGDFAGRRFDARSGALIVQARAV